MALLLNIALIHSVKFLNYALQLHIDRHQEYQAKQTPHFGSCSWPFNGYCHLFGDF